MAHLSHKFTSGVMSCCIGCGGFRGNPLMNEPCNMSMHSKMEYCCDCCEEYPRSELLAGEVFCRKCRETVEKPQTSPAEKPMILRPTITVSAELTVNDIEAEVLEHICGYGLAEWFEKHCSTRFKAKFIQDTLTSIRSKCEKIVEARDNAMKAVKGVN